MVTILVCEDDEDDRMLTSQALDEARAGNAVRFVEDGEELLDYLHRRGAYEGDPQVAPRPGLILLDLHMPRMNGIDALKAIKGDSALCDIPVVVLTTSAREQDIVRSYRFGVNAFITKPVSYAGLVDAMSVLGRYWLDIVRLPPVAA